MDEKILIVSNDKDFQQLQRYPNVKQYSPAKKKFLDCKDPEIFLLDHIITGDSSDGIPNILTCDDAIVSGKTQKKMSKDKIATLASMDPSEFTNYIRLRNWKRNAELIDLWRIPEPVVERILITVFKNRPAPAVNIDYFTQYNLTDILDEFS